MTTTSPYRQLVDDLCKACGIADSAGMMENCILVIDDVVFTLMEGSFIDDDTLMLYCDFGEPPAELYALVLRRILESNFFMYGNNNAPDFSFNPDTGRLVLMSRMPLSAATADKLLYLMGEYADYATLWRRTYFLDETERNKQRLGSLAGNARPGSADAMRRTFNVAQQKMPMPRDA